MKMTDYILMYIAIGFCFGAIIFFNINLQGKAEILNTEYANKLAAACHDAAATIQKTEIDNYGSAWSRQEKRKETLDVFYDTLAYSFNAEYSTKFDEIVLYTPVVCLIDIDGFYISYNVVFDETGYVDIPANAMDRNAVLPINTWSAPCPGSSGYIIRYRLNDNVDVITDENRVYSGERNEVFARIKADKERILAGYHADDLNELKNLLTNDEVFVKERNNLIIRQINSQIEYYINQHNTIGDGYEQKYTFTMPEVSGEDWARLLENPTVISFLQGRSAKLKNRLLNVYSLAGGELAKEYHYFITNENGYKEYHCLEAPCGGRVTRHEGTRTVQYYEDNQLKQKTIPTVTYRYNGHEISRMYSSMEECAREGAVPHSCVYDWR